MFGECLASVVARDASIASSPARREGSKYVRNALVRTALGAALAALLLTLAPVGIASASSDIGPGINSFYNSRCLDADLGSIGGNGTVVQLWDCAGASNQLRYTTDTPRPGVYKIHSFYNDRCLDADLGSIGGNGTRIQLWDCGGDFWHNQNWYGS